MMIDRTKWLLEFDGNSTVSTVEGLISVDGYDQSTLSPEQVAVMEKAADYKAKAVFFEASKNGRSPVAQAFVFVSDGSDDEAFAELHQRLWSWGGVPLVYRKAKGIVQLFRCAHKPDFSLPNGKRVCKPIDTLNTATAINDWWDASQLHNGTLWDHPYVCEKLLAADKAAHKRLFNAVRALYIKLNDQATLPQELRQRLLVLSLLIAYLEERRVLLPNDFEVHLAGASTFFHILVSGEALVKLLAALEIRFNGNVFSLSQSDQRVLQETGKLANFATLIEANQESSGQRTLWKLYSFKDLPVELISNIYQLFVKKSSSVYTPPFLVRLVLDEALGWDRIDQLQQSEEIILDPACGSGVFLVEAYKRLVLHWRSRNGWRLPDIDVLKQLLQKVHGIDLEEGAVELAGFSLCLALCDALEPEPIRNSIKLFDPLVGKTLHHSCFFAAKEKKLIKAPIGIITGNPPFESKLTTEGAKRSYKSYEKVFGRLPDKQLSYLFLHEAMSMLDKGGILCMLQQAGFLYNQNSKEFRTNFITRYNVREILDFVSVRGLFQKGGGDTKVVVVVAEHTQPNKDRDILHVTFRRSGRVDAEQGFDVDYYDLHWLSRKIALTQDSIWRANLLGGGRVFEFVERLKKFRTLGAFADKPGWDVGEGFIAGKQGTLIEAPHLTGSKLIEPFHLQEQAILTDLKVVKETHFISPRSPTRFQSPMVLIHEHEDLTSRHFMSGYYAYKDKTIGFCAPKSAADEIKDIANWLKVAIRPLQAFVTAGGTSSFTQRASALSLNDIKILPYPETGSLDLSTNEQILIDDILDYYRDLVRLGDKAPAMNNSGRYALSEFNHVFEKQINTIYAENPLRALDAHLWPGIICQPFVFGNGEVDWSGTEELKDKLDKLLHEQSGENLHIVRITRIYDGNFMFLLKPDQLRYWLRSVALRDADETLCNLREQGF